uniref:Uncharacterized protein n=1 Tax=Tanacetum cinerariifolium TaxID=118510 RepID=A0A6L2KS95_TANCI|nr:hypothetical protein [Tanacetum cinerariifolium]
MDPNSSLRKICLGDDVIVISSEKVKGSRDWNSLEYQDTTGSKGKKVMNALSFYMMKKDEVNERYITPCFVNGLEAYDGEINLAFDENLISNEYAVNLCLDYELNKGNKVVKKQLIVALKGELYFVKFIINLEEDDVEPAVILGRSFMRLAKEIVNFGNGVITIYLEPDPFEDVSEKTEKSPNDWDKLLDFSFDEVPTFGEELPLLVFGRHLTQEEAAKEALEIRINQSFTLLKEVELDGKIIKEEEEAVKRIKADTESNIDTMPCQIYETLGREEMKKVDRGITMINHTQAEAMGILTNVFCQVAVTTIIAKFIILDIIIDPNAPIVVGRGFLYTVDSILNTPENFFSTFDGVCHQTFRDARFDVLKTTESDSDDEEEYQIKKNKFGASIYGPKPAPYLNCNNPADRSLAIQTVTNLFCKISVWKKEEHSMMRPDHQDPNDLDNMKPWRKYCFHKFTMNFCYVKVDVLNMMGCNGEIDDMLRIRLREDGSDEETFTSKIIKFRLGGRAHSLTLLEFARRLGLYQAAELDEEGFNVYFEGGLHSDEHFNAQEYWLRSHASTIKYLKNDLWLLSMFHAKHQNGYANVAWLVARWMKRKGAGTQKESQICCGQFILKIARKSRVLTKDVLRSLSAPVYCRDLDTTTLIELIDTESRLIPKDPQPGVPRVGIPIPPRASMQDLHDRMGIHQEAT